LFAEKEQHIHSVIRDNPNTKKKTKQTGGFSNFEGWPNAIFPGNGGAEDSGDSYMEFTGPIRTAPVSLASSQKSGYRHSNLPAVIKFNSIF